ncbi:MAG: endonuclease/exonuclease/phosphatase family protein [Pyrinomonadaceae bacterium]
MFSLASETLAVQSYMTSPADSIIGPPTVLDHDLNQYFPDLLKFESNAEMQASDLYKKIRPDVERIMNAVVVESFARPVGNDSETITALAWNLERGIQFEGILDALKNHERLKDKDLLILTELDYGMARSGTRFVAQEIATELGLNYAFAPVYIPLQKGSGVESDMDGENTVSIHGLAMFSRFPMKNVHAVPLPNGKDKMWGKEKRIGYLRAIVADVGHPTGDFRAVTIHLDAHCSRAHRVLQIKIILDHLDTLPPMPTLIGGDWNTTGFNSQSSTRAIMGYWRRVLMGPRNVALNHLPHPERYFEKHLFTGLEKRGYHFRDLNNIGVGTLHYDIGSIEKNTNLRDWVPEWCFPFIFWAAGRVGGLVSARLDWFAANGLKPAPGTMPQTVSNLVSADKKPLSDHDAITVDLVRSTDT